MIKEFALDPACLTEQDAKHLVRECGFDKARIICEYPRKWARKLYDFLDANGIDTTDPRRITATNLLQELRATSSLWPRTNASGFDSTKSWLDNVQAEHKREPFDAIVSTKGTPGSGADGVVALDDLWSKGSPWGVATQLIVGRNPRDLAKAVFPLVRYSDTVRFCDPYISGSANKGPAVEFIKFTVEAATTERVSPRPLTVEVHVLVREEKKEVPKIALGGLRQALEGQLPKEIPIRIIAWPELIKPGQKFHNRFVLTELGGVRFGDSFDGDGNPRSGTDDLNLLEPHTHRERWNLFDWKQNQPLDKIGCE